MAQPDMIVPRELLHLVAAGIWPQPGKDRKERGQIIVGQQARPLVSEERVQVFAPDETLVVLFPPPFAQLKVERLALHMFLGAPDPIYSPGDLDFARCLDIGDFGLGSDSPIVLDYRSGPENPPVLRLQWGTDGVPLRNRWTTIAPSFREFAKLLGFLN